MPPADKTNRMLIDWLQCKKRERERGERDPVERSAKKCSLYIQYINCFAWHSSLFFSSFIIHCDDTQAPPTLDSNKFQLMIYLVKMPRTALPASWLASPPIAFSKSGLLCSLWRVNSIILLIQQLEHTLALRRVLVVILLLFFNRWHSLLLCIWSTLLSVLRVCCVYVIKPDYSYAKCAGFS